MHVLRHCTWHGQVSQRIRSNYMCIQSLGLFNRNKQDIKFETNVLSLGEEDCFNSKINLT